MDMEKVILKDKDQKDVIMKGERERSQRIRIKMAVL